MSRFFRFLSRRGTARGGSLKDEKPNKNILVCRVIMLDGTDATFDIPVSIKAFCLISHSVVMCVRIRALCLGLS